MDISKLKNIYTILEEIDFDKRVLQVKKSIDRGVDPKQAIFSIIQPFYENIIESLIYE